MSQTELGVEATRCFYRIAEITIQIDADLPFTNNTHEEKFRVFRVEGPGSDNVSLRLHFRLPEPGSLRLGREVYRHPPHAVFESENYWTYLGIAPDPRDATLHRVAVFSRAHDDADIYSPNERAFRRGNLASLSLFNTDMILLTQLLADRRGFCLHAAGVVLDGGGVLFVGPSEAGKSTATTMLKDCGVVLSDENMILRLWPEGFKIHGTWSHGDVPIVSNDSAYLKAIFFLEKAGSNRLKVIEEKRDVVGRLLPRLLKPLVTYSWWEKTLVTVDRLVAEIPAYRMEFDTSGRIREVLKECLQSL